MTLSSISHWLKLMLIFSTKRIIILIQKESKCWDFPQAQKLNKNLPFPSDFSHLNQKK
jgi:hypothetical protein